MWPHYGQSSRENATPSSGRSPLASYKEVPPPTPGVISQSTQLLDSQSETVLFCSDNYLRLVFLSPFFILFFLPTDSFMIVSESKHLHVTFIWQPEKSEDVEELFMYHLWVVSTTLNCTLLYITLLCFTLLSCTSVYFIYQRF